MRDERTSRHTWRDRFWKYVTPAGPDECWEWQGGRANGGYGKISRGPRNGGHIRAHRASYEMHVGPVPDGMFVCHRCDNPPCVNPAHLFLGSPKDNIDDMMRKGRDFRGRGGAKLTDEQVRELREARAAGARIEELSERFGINSGQVSRIARGEARPEAGGPFTKATSGRGARRKDQIAVRCSRAKGGPR